LYVDGFSDYYYLKDKFESLGFPHLNESAYNPCGVIGLNDGCSKSGMLNFFWFWLHANVLKELISGMLKISPVSVPNRRAVYSQLSFSLLSYALTAHTGGKSYKTILEDYLTIPFGLKNTSPDPGDYHMAVIPPVPSSYGAYQGESVP